MKIIPILRKRTVLATAGFMALVLAVAGLSVAWTGQVSRPFQITGTATGEITSVAPDLTITSTYKGVGEATHCGRFLDEGTSTLSLVTGKGTGEGTFVAADGSKWFYTFVVDGATFTVTTTGGTGRFKGGTCEFVAQLDNLQVDLTAGTTSYTYVGSGEITY